MSNQKQVLTPPLEVTVRRNLIKNNVLKKYLPKPIRAVRNVAEELEVRKLWVRAYKSIYPNYKIPRHDPQNTQAHILFTRNEKGKVNSSIRLTVDSPLGLPSGKFYPPEVAMYRELGYKLMEFGRMVNREHNVGLLKSYHRAVYEIAKAEKVDVIIMILKQKDVAFYHNMMGAYLLLSDIKMPVGGKYKMSCVVWEVNKTKPRFLKWVGLNQATYGELA